MAIFGIGAYYGSDVSGDFTSIGVAGVGWGEQDAPELHRFVRSLKVGDIVYIKAYPPGTKEIFVKSIGLITDDAIRTAADTSNLVSIGRNVHWVTTQEFHVPRPNEKNNVRANTLYEECHPEVQTAIMAKLRAGLSAPRRDDVSQRCGWCVRSGRQSASPDPNGRAPALRSSEDRPRVSGGLRLPQGSANRNFLR